MAILKEFLVKQKVGNCEDYVTIPNWSDVAKQSNISRIADVSDYSILNGATISTAFRNKSDNASLYYVLGSDVEGKIQQYVDSLGRVEDITSKTQAGYKLKIKLDLAKLQEFYDGDLTKLGIFEDDDEDGKPKLKIKLGSYPSKVCSQQFERELDKIYKASDKNTLQQIYLRFTGSQPVYAPCIIYRGEKYVKLSSIANDGIKLSDKTSTNKNKNEYWVKVSPITWTIINNEEVQEVLDGTKDAEGVNITLISDNTLVESTPISQDWESSPIRDYLNGVTSKFASSFLDDAGFSTNIDKNVRKTRQSIKFDFDPMTNEELLWLSIKARVPVFLHGPSGVGKSSRVKAIDPGCIPISLTRGMDPAKVEGHLNKTENQAKKASRPPVWYLNLKEKCEAEPDKIHILFIDELCNVIPEIQSLVYSIVLDRATADGLWKLPENCVVIGAGNEQADSSAAYPLTEPLFRRFTHIYYKINLEDFLKWGMQISQQDQREELSPSVPFTKVDDESNQTNIHPLIALYLMSHATEINKNIKEGKDSLLFQSYDEDDPRIVTDPRKWGQASRLFIESKNEKGEYNPWAISHAVGDKITKDFVMFCKGAILTVDDVIEKNYNESDLISKDLSQKYAIIAGLVDATEDELPNVRDFIAQVFGDEFVAKFDIMWIRGDQDRTLFIKELQDEIEFSTSTGSML